MSMINIYHHTKKELSVSLHSKARKDRQTDRQTDRHILRHDKNISFKALNKSDLLKKFWLDQCPFCGTTDSPYFELCVTPIGFKARLVLSPAHLFACVCGEPKGHVWCYTCLFHQQGCTLHKYVYSSLAFQTSLM